MNETGRNLFLDKVGKNKKKLEKIEYYNPPRPLLCTNGQVTRWKMQSRNRLRTG